MPEPHHLLETPWVVVGLDNGGTCNNATVLTESGEFLVDRLVENPSRVNDGPQIAVVSLAKSFETIIDLTGTPRSSVRAIGLDTPGPASADGVISSKGATNFSEVGWHGFDFRSALEAYDGLPVVYHNDGNAAALYAHYQYFGDDALQRSSVAAIVGTGLGGGVVESGRVVKGAAGMAKAIDRICKLAEAAVGANHNIVILSDRAMDQDHIAYEATLEDPKIFARPWKMHLTLYRIVDKGSQLLEFKCIPFAEELLYGDFRKHTGR